MNTADTPTDIVRTFINALEGNDLDSAASNLTDDFQFSGWTPKPLDKKNFLAVMQGLKDGIPGLMFNLHNLEEGTDNVSGVIQAAGYQSHSFILPPLGTPPIPQMATSISLPTEEVTFTLANGQLARWSVRSGPEGGIRGILRQLGTDLPLIQ